MSEIWWINFIVSNLDSFDITCLDLSESDQMTYITENMKL